MSSKNIRNKAKIESKMGKSKILVVPSSSP